MHVGYAYTDIILVLLYMQSSFKKDLEECTLDGTVDWHGHPAIKNKSGKWIAGIIILCKQQTKNT